MEMMLFGLVIGIAVALIGVAFVRGRRRGDAEAAPTVHSSVDSFRAVGELVVLKVFTQQIVTKTDHLLGDWGEKWLAWMLSPKKTAMIFDFVVDFRYDLKSPQFVPEIQGEDGVKITMPPCFYEIQMKDIQIYDERASALAPVLLPEWAGQILGGKFSEKEKNQLIQAARQEAEGLARRLAERMIGEVQHGAESTLRPIAKAVGFTSASFAFSEASPVQGGIDLSIIEASAERAVAGATAQS